MFEIGWTELLVIGVVALIVIGPRDLPEMFRQLGRFTGKMRAMARDFQRAMDQAANETGLKDVARDLKTAGSLKSTGLDAVKNAASKFEKWDPLQNAARPSVPAAGAALAATSVVTAAAPVQASGAPTVGPETQALLDAQAKRQAIIAESTERLRAVTAKPAAVAAPEPAPMPETALVSETIKSARKARPKVEKPDMAAADETKPKKPRKSGSKADQA